ncbi:MAG: nuclear transport factor 2 family protein [Gemmatimonas sp.]
MGNKLRYNFVLALAGSISLAAAPTSHTRSLPTASAQAAAGASAATPAQNRAALLTADKTFGSNSANTDLISGLSAMFADSVTLIALGEQFHGVSAAREALGRNADNAKSTITWTPIQGDVSADGNIGYTMGFTTWKKPDGSQVPGKYVAFWAKQRGAWRVLVYKRTARAAGDVAIVEEAAPVKPAPGNAQYSAADSTRFAHELDAAERGFSDQAAVIGLGAAFTKNSATDAHHTGGATDADFRRGPADIGAGISAGGEPPLGSIKWAPDVVYVARSGDLGITFGMITIAQATGAPRRVSYLTVWKRNSVTDPWKLAIE